MEEGRQLSGREIETGAARALAGDLQGVACIEIDEAAAHLATVSSADHHDVAAIEGAFNPGDTGGQQAFALP